MVDWISAIWVVWEVAYILYAVLWERRTVTTPEWITTGLGVLFAFAILLFEFRRRIAETKHEGDARVEHANELADAKREAAVHHASLSAQIQMGTLLQVKEFRELQGLTHTTEAPVVTTIAMANTDIAVMRSELADFRSMFWRRLTDDEKEHLKDKLAAIGSYRFRIVSGPATDCKELQADLTQVFESAGWPRVSATSVIVEHGLDDEVLVGISGIRVIGKYNLDNLDNVPEPGPKVADALTPLLRFGVSFGVGLRGDLADVVLFIGPKGHRSVLPDK
jgi:hypothetical protein